jgi:hypothetical protein
MAGRELLRSRRPAAVEKMQVQNDPGPYAIRTGCGTVFYRLVVTEDFAASNLSTRLLRFCAHEVVQKWRGNLTSDSPPIIFPLPVWDNNARSVAALSGESNGPESPGVGHL